MRGDVEATGLKELPERRQLERTQRGDYQSQRLLSDDCLLFGDLTLLA